MSVDRMRRISPQVVHGLSGPWPGGGGGSAGTSYGGWLYRFGPEPLEGDKFRLGEIMDNGALLLGRRTFEEFAALWPRRDDWFSARMNAWSKLVVSRSLADASM